MVSITAICQIFMFSSLVILAEANTDLSSKSYLLLSDHTINLSVYTSITECLQRATTGFRGFHWYDKNAVCFDAKLNA